MKIVVTFDLKGADSNDYPEVRKKLEEFGLKTTALGESGAPVHLPHNTFAGEVGEQLGNDMSVARDKLHKLIGDTAKTEVTRFLVAEYTILAGYGPIESTGKFSQ